MSDLTINTSQLIANDIGSGLRVTAVSQPTKGGSLVFNGTTIEYTAGANQQDDFTYTVTDQWGFTSTAKVTVTVKKTGTVTAVDDTFDYPQDECPPVTATEKQFTRHTTTIVITEADLLADGSGDGRFLASIVQGPSSGTLQFDTGARTVTYTATQDNNSESIGIDGFVFRVENYCGSFAENQAVIFRDIAPPPTGEDVTYSYRFQPDSGKYYARGSVELTAHSNFSDIGFASQETFGILGYQFQYLSGQLRQDMEIVMSAINYGTNNGVGNGSTTAFYTYVLGGITADFTDANGVRVMSDEFGFMNLYRSTPFTNDEIQALPPQIFGNVTRGVTTGHNTLLIYYDDIKPEAGTEISVSAHGYPNYGKVIETDTCYIYIPNDPTNFRSDSFTFTYRRPNTSGGETGIIKIN